MSSWFQPHPKGQESVSCAGLVILPEPFQISATSISKKSPRSPGCLLQNGSGPSEKFLSRAEIFHDQKGVKISQQGAL